MQNYYSVEILPVSMDGRPLQNGLFQDFSVPNAQIIDQFKIREVPTIFLVSKDGSSAQRISEGMITAEELKNTIILAAKGMNLIDDASFQSTLDVKRQYTIGEDGVITVNKSENGLRPVLIATNNGSEIGRVPISYGGPGELPECGWQFRRPICTLTSKLVQKSYFCR